MNLFFPSHDIALGNGVKHFNPPAAALRLQEDLAWLEEIFSTPSHPHPWGWSWDTRQYIHQEHKVPLNDLPTDAQLEALRQLSSRRTTIGILESLHFNGQTPEYLTNKKRIEDFIARSQKEGFEYVMKTPWSSSGRGLIRSTVTPIDTVKKRALSTIHKMGGIMAEKWFDKQQDFAMLFFVGHDAVQPLGYSLFDNEESGTYRQGYLLSNEEIEHRLTDGTGVTIDQLRDLQSRMLQILTHLFAPFFGLPWQVGYIGIDMMILSHLSTLNPPLHPCVELNLRCTMGVVARLWSDRHLKPGQTGRFVISPMGDDGHFNAHFLID